MSEGQAEPPEDVRSFLPRPGEPVEAYAERLRGLHRDLTLVLQAVERGLAVSSDPEAMPAPVPAGGDHHQDEHEVHAEPALQAPIAVDMPMSTLMRPSRGGPRVEVMAPPAGAQGRDEAEERRRPVAPDEPQVPAPAAFPARPSVREPEPDTDPTWLHHPAEASILAPPAPAPAPAPAAAPVARVVERPRQPAEREHPWVEGPPIGSWSAHVADRGPRRAVPPWILAAALAGWLVVLAFVLALAVG
jgi:hypothetical protein